MFLCSPSYCLFVRPKPTLTFRLSFFYFLEDIPNRNLFYFSLHLLNFYNVKKLLVVSLGTIVFRHWCYLMVSI